MDSPASIDADIRSAWTLDSATYGDPVAYAAQLERVFAPSWQLITTPPPATEDAVPFTLLERSLDEPLMMLGVQPTRVLSNVCTHRGALLLSAPCKRSKGLRCPYHGRRFDAEGRFVSMPEFEEARSFPSPGDDLPTRPCHALGPLRFTALLDPANTFDDHMAPVLDRLGDLPGYRWTAAAHDPSEDRAYTVEAHWALYCDNYLEGFHVPFVHPGLNATLDYGSYTTELLPTGVLQIGEAKPGELAFALPAGHRDAGRDVAAYYFWLFPNLMLNFYPWGVSVNIVEPTGPRTTRVTYRAYVLRPELRDQGAGAALHQVELEDDAIVASVQRGVSSRLYKRGRFSPRRERGVHHFHRLLERALSLE